ncbi:hypothetical protein [Cardinium endosymbiont of Culicoides punctatus]|uniref:hypothetical protein n=1 Tax=Cardinium endosymbiont of Culicoides punctatus TaxID=2304601 RepID=UPI001058D34D|nr:hypothetical protein [Cardinium endosymbiont of Culicoides punctatus]TDG95464.1 hypothetical protein CCPUN_03640 [Cardinium endosymbiont of Culicoides punctatus]
MFRNLYYLVLGIILGAILGILVCDETKKKITEAIRNKSKLLSGCCKSSSDKVVETVKAYLD